MPSSLQKFAFRLIAVLVLLILILSLASVWLVRRSFPTSEGDVHIRGLNAPVEVIRDLSGAPHIYAATQHDLFMAQGYCHAQDRFWQMDFWRHTGSGRLSEMFGRSLVKTDAFLRTLGWARVVQQELQHIDPTSRSILEAYAEGVNAYLSDHDGSSLSLEHMLLAFKNRDMHIEPWIPLNTLTWGKAMAWDLGMNMDEEIYRSALLKMLSVEKVEQLFPEYPKDGPFILPDANVVKTSRRLAPAMLRSVTNQIAALIPYIGVAENGIGSNNWVISGKRTTTGKPLLANDPHLGTQMPSIWYQNHLQCTPRTADCPYDVAGFSLAGVPGVIIGHNDRVAWGFTNVGPDVEDLYIEKINPQNPNQYEVNGKWIDMRIIKETIHVFDSNSESINVRYTRHGPVISDVSHQVQNVQQTKDASFPEKYAIALRWTALDPTVTFPAIWKMNLARNWDDFRGAAADFDVPSQNCIYADVDGNIGYQVPGKIPIRANGDGRYPVPGWTDEYEWTGYIPFEKLPHVYNPQQGYVATANNAVTSEDYPYLITNDWDYGFRARRIREMIENARQPMDIAYVQKMQGDNKNLNAADLVPLLLHIPMEDARLRAAREILRKWDFQQGMDSAPAALFEMFWKHLLAATFHDDLPADYWPGGGNRTVEIVQILAQQPNSFWWDNKKTAAVERRDPIFLQAFASAVDELEKKQGKDPSAWNWGMLHTVSFQNATFGKSGNKLLEILFNRGPLPTSGGTAIVNATAWDAVEDSFQVTWLPSMRMIVDLSNLSNSLTILTTGQSGHPFHPHYFDQAEAWSKIQYRPMFWSRSQVESNSEGILHLLP